MENCEDFAVLMVTSENKVPTAIKHESRDSITDVLNTNTTINESLVQSFSAESLSLSINLEEECDEELNGKDLIVRVDNPQKHVDSLETYITFRITTKTTREEFSDSEYVVRRRYSDFVWLRHKLVDAYPTHIIPPLPAKHSLLGQLDRYSREFVVSRMAMLHRFLNQIVCHPVLSSHPTFHVFLTAKCAEFLMHRKDSKGLIERKSESLHQLANTFTYHQIDPEFEAMGEYIEALSEKLTTIEKIGDRIHRKRKDYLTELKNCCHIISSWADIETVARPVLLDVGVAIETAANAQQEHLVDPYQITISQPLRDCLLYLEAINEALARRDSIQIDYEIAVDEMNRLKIEKEQVINSDSSTSSQIFSFWKPVSSQDRIEKLDLAIPKSLKVVETSQDKLEVANGDLRADMERWKQEKKSDLKKTLIKMADQHINYYKQCLEAWKKVWMTLKDEDKNQNNGASTSTSHFTSWS